jgi:hypothetical protein
MPSSSLVSQPESRWFTDSVEDSDELRFRDWQLRRLWRRSIQCTERQEHEAGWNDSVHGPLLYDTFTDVSSVTARNM